MPKNTTSNNFPILRGEKHDISPKFLHQAGFKTARQAASCHLRSDSHTTGLTLTTGVLWSCTKRKGASNMNIHYDITSLLSAVWKVNLSRLSELAREEGGGRILIAHMLISRCLLVYNWIDEDGQAVTSAKLCTLAIERGPSHLIACLFLCPCSHQT